MKKLVLTSLATAAMAAAAFGQGAIVVDNSTAVPGIALGTAGTYYTGTLGIEVFYLNGSSVPTGINTGSATAMDAYTALTGSMTKAATFAGTSTPAGYPGVVQLGEVDIAGATKGGNIILGLAAWTGNYASFAAAEAANAKGGVIAFSVPTADYTAAPKPTIPDISDAWTAYGQDLVMTQLSVVSVPEPSTFALAGLGAAAMLIFRRRK